MEKILQSDNLNESFKKVKSNKGAGGVDGMSVDELLLLLKGNQKQLVQKLRDGKYNPRGSFQVLYLSESSILFCRHIQDIKSIGNFSKSSPTLWSMNIYFIFELKCILNIK